MNLSNLKKIIIQIDKFIKFIKFYIKFLIIILNLILLFNNFEIKTRNIGIDTYLNVFKRTKIKQFDELYFEISSIKYFFSYIFHIVKVEYSLAFYDLNNNLIRPSDITLYYNLHMFCNIFHNSNNISIISISYIIENKYYNCIEYFVVGENINIGITIYKKIKYFEYIRINLFTDKLIDYNKFIFNLNNEFDPFIIINNHIKLEKKINEELNNINSTNKIFLLKHSYLSIPNFYIKSFFAKNEMNWYFKNIYNYYFCYCKHSNINKCLFQKMVKKCKYNLYLNIIDNSQHLYKKTDYLLADFSLPETAPCEAYLLFKEMIKKNLNAHFMTQREDIFIYFNNSQYINNIPIIYGSTYIDGDFLEKYLTIFLKLKATISGAKIYSINNLFYNIPYITYISLGHGISLLKDFLYIDYYSSNIYNKIVLPSSDIIIDNAMKYGWRIDNILKFGLPRWDIFAKSKRNNIFKADNRSSIFIMFTWREIKRNKYISKYYFTNIFNLINNVKLGNILKKKKIYLHFSLHHNIENYKNFFPKKEYLKYINQEGILECLSKTNLIVTDFSSIIFDILIRYKPFIIYVPDSEDNNLEILYNQTYFDIINGLKNDSINFENKYFNIEEVIDKIIYYINNNFQLEPKLKMFYNSFNLIGGKNIINLINFLKNLK